MTTHFFVADDKLSINGAERKKYNQSRGDRKQWQQRNRIFFANLHFRVGSQKAYYDGHTDKIGFTNGSAVW